jgi:hypothetical protein
MEIFNLKDYFYEEYKSFKDICSESANRIIDVFSVAIKNWTDLHDEENPEVKFHFYGNHSTASNIGTDSSKANLDYLEQIKNRSNSVFHGVLCKRELALELNQMDAFLICYDPQKGQSSGSNSHKILEFLSTGKVIFSSHFSYYEGTDLFVMNTSRVDNTLLIGLFQEGISALNQFNNSHLKEGRMIFSQENSYDQNLLKIIS